jgi:hypothetical protein
LSLTPGACNTHAGRKLPEAGFPRHDRRHRVSFST